MDCSQKYKDVYKTTLLLLLLMMMMISTVTAAADDDDAEKEEEKDYVFILRYHGLLFILFIYPTVFCIIFITNSPPKMNG